MLDLRRIDGFEEEISWREWRKIWDMYAKMVHELLECNWLNVKKTTWVDLGSRSGVVLDRYISSWLNMLWLDARPWRKDIIESRVEDMPFDDEAISYLTSSLLFDRKYYDQDTQGMLDEIWRVLRPWGLYIGFEFNEWLESIDGCSYRDIPKISWWYPEVIRAQVFKKWKENISIPDSIFYDSRNIIWNRSLLS